MKATFKYELTDEQRNEFKNRTTGKVRKALAKRIEINDFLQGCLDSFLAGETPSVTTAAGSPVPKSSQEAGVRHIYSPDELAEIDRLRAEGHDDSYIRGWMQVYSRGRK